MFESPVDFNSSQTMINSGGKSLQFESPVDFNSSQTLAVRHDRIGGFESPVDFNSSQTRSGYLSSSLCLRAL